MQVSITKTHGLTSSFTPRLQPRGNKCSPVQFKGKGEPGPSDDNPANPAGNEQQVRRRRRRSGSNAQQSIASSPETQPPPLGQAGKGKRKAKKTNQSPGSPTANATPADVQPAQADVQLHGQPEAMQVVESVVNQHLVQLQEAVPPGQAGHTALDSDELMESLLLQNKEVWQPWLSSADTTPNLATTDLHVAAAAIEGALLLSTTTEVATDAVTQSEISDVQSSDEAALLSASSAADATTSSEASSSVEQGSTEGVQGSAVQHNLGQGTCPGGASSHVAHTAVERLREVLHEMQADVSAETSLDWQALKTDELSRPEASAAFDWPSTGGVMASRQAYASDRSDTSLNLHDVLESLEGEEVGEHQHGKVDTEASRVGGSISKVGDEAGQGEGHHLAEPVIKAATAAAAEHHQNDQVADEVVGRLREVLHEMQADMMPERSSDWQELQQVQAYSWSNPAASNALDWNTSETGGDEAVVSEDATAEDGSSDKVQEPAGDAEVEVAKEAGSAVMAAAAGAAVEAAGEVGAGGEGVVCQGHRPEGSDPPVDKRHDHLVDERADPPADPAADPVCDPGFDSVTDALEDPLLSVEHTPRVDELRAHHRAHQAEFATPTTSDATETVNGTEQDMRPAAVADLPSACEDETSECALPEPPLAATPVEQPPADEPECKDEGSPSPAASPPPAAAAAVQQPAEQPAELELDELHLRPAGSPEPATAGELLDQLRLKTPESGEHDAFEAGLSGGPTATDAAHVQARAERLAEFQGHTGLDSETFLHDLNTPGNCTDCTEQEQQQAEQVASLPEAMDAARQAMEEQAQQQQEEAEQAASAAAAGDSAAEGGDSQPCLDPEVVAADARLMLLDAMAEEVKAVRSEVQQTVQSLKELKAALLMAQQNTGQMPADASMALQQSIVQEMARLDVELESAYQGMATLSKAMTVLSQGNPLPVLHTVDQYMEFLEELAMGLAHGQPSKGDDGQGVPLSARLVASAEAIRDQVSHALELGAPPRPHVDEDGTTTPATPQQQDEQQQQQQQGEEGEGGAVSEQAAGEVGQDAGVEQDPPRVPPKPKVLPSRLGTRLLALAKQRLSPHLEPQPEEQEQEQESKAGGDQEAGAIPEGRAAGVQQVSDTSTTSSGSDSSSSADEGMRDAGRSGEVWHKGGQYSGVGMGGDGGGSFKPPKSTQVGGGDSDGRSGSGVAVAVGFAAVLCAAVGLAANKGMLGTSAQGVVANVGERMGWATLLPASKGARKDDEAHTAAGDESQAELEAAASATSQGHGDDGQSDAPGA